MTSGWEASSTWIRKSDERGFLERGVECFHQLMRQLRTKPTVSVSKSGCLLGSAIFRVVVSSVAKSLFSMKTSAPVSRRRSEDLPTFV